VNNQIQLEYSLLSIALQQTPWQINDHVEFMLDGTADPAEVDPTAFEHVPGTVLYIYALLTLPTAPAFPWIRFVSNQHLFSFHFSPHSFTSTAKSENSSSKGTTDLFQSTSFDCVSIRHHRHCFLPTLLHWPTLVLPHVQEMMFFPYSLPSQ
jgi:hypothetical protein